MSWALRGRDTGPGVPRGPGRPYCRARATGGGPALVTAAERAARDMLGASVIRLDTRKDLVEARALYARLGYQEIPAYRDSCGKPRRSL